MIQTSKNHQNTSELAVHVFSRIPPSFQILLEYTRVGKFEVDRVFLVIFENFQVLWRYSRKSPKGRFLCHQNILNSEVLDLRLVYTYFECIEVQQCSKVQQSSS